MTFKKY